MDHTQTQPTPQPEQEPKPKNKRRGLKAVLLLIAVLLFAGAIGYAVYAWQQSKISNLNTKVQTLEANQKEDRITESVNTPEEATINEEPETLTHGVNGATFELPAEMGQLLQYQLTNENTNLSSGALLAEEKRIYGDAQLVCNANDYALGRISIRHESTPYPGFELVKQLPSGKYLYYQDDAKSSFCYKSREQLREMIDAQVSAIKSALKDAK